MRGEFSIVRVEPRTQVLHRTTRGSRGRAAREGRKQVVNVALTYEVWGEGRESCLSSKKGGRGRFRKSRLFTVFQGRLRKGGAKQT